MPAVFIVIWLAAIIAAQMLASRKGRTNGWAWGLLLGWLGVLVVACMANRASQKLAAKQLKVAELEADLRLAELRRQQTDVGWTPQR
jgi:hypothetical protein